MKNICSRYILLIVLLTTSGFFYDAGAQKARNFEIGWSFGVFRSKVQDNWDNSIIYGNSVFQPYRFHIKAKGGRWTHMLDYYYVKNKLQLLTGTALFSYNYVLSRSGELSYNAAYKIYQSETSGFSLNTGLGVHAFGSARERKTKSKRYPQEDFIQAYDINGGSLQLIINPEYRKNRNLYSFSVSAGVLNYVTRPDYYNPRFNYNNGKWELVSLDKHFNLLGTLFYRYKISERFCADMEYRFFYYSYSFPYKLKVLNQNWFIGLSFKF